MIKTKEEAFDYINEQESSNISFCKIGEDSNNLVVSFSHNGHRGFMYKQTLMKFKYEKNNFDVLYLRNQGKWYLGTIPGIGRNIFQTLAFLKQKICGYDKIIFLGGSAGGYASLLYGSLLKVDVVIAGNPQTDLNYVLENVGKKSNNHYFLSKRKRKSKDVWQKYHKLDGVLNNEVKYFIYLDGDDLIKKLKRNLVDDLILHGDYHFNLIKNFPTVFRLKKESDILQTLFRELI